MWKTSNPVLDLVAGLPHRVCLMLDGLDETKLESCSNFTITALHGEELNGARLI